VPKSTPAETVDTSIRDYRRLADPKIKARICRLGRHRASRYPADFGKLSTDEIEAWGNVVKFSVATRPLLAPLRAGRVRRRRPPTR
jgi:hypothetical protein